LAFAQAGILEDALDAQSRELSLAVDSAINETTHRSFALSAMLRKMKN